MVWNDIENFLCSPSRVLKGIQERMLYSDVAAKDLKKEIEALESELQHLKPKKQNIVSLHVEGEITKEEFRLERQKIEDKEKFTESELVETQHKLRQHTKKLQHCQSVEHLLLRCRQILKGGLTFEVKRKIVEALVDHIQVDTHIEGKVGTATVTVSYLFEEPQERLL